MAIYQYTAPDGNKYRVNAPEGATDDQVYGLVLQNYPYAGQTTKELESAKSAPSTLKDVGLATGQGLVGGIQSLTNLFGTDNAASKYLGGVQQSAFEALSPARKEEIARRQELQDRAKGDLGKEISTGVGGFLEAPLQTGLQALASSAPIIAGGLLPGGQVAAGASLGARALAGARGATGIGGLMGVGGQKGQDYEAVKQALLAQGVDPMIAEQKAQEAAAYSLQNAPRQLAAGAAGALEGAFGVEQALANAAKKVSKANGVASLDAPTFKQAVGTSVLGEAAPEAVQAGVGQVGTNVALNQAGVATDLTEGLAGTVAHDALVGAVLGLAVSPAQMSNLQRSHQQAKADDQAKKQAQFDQELKAANDKAVAERAVLEKQTEGIRQQMEQQQAIALPAPAEEIPAEEVQIDPLKNPLGNIRKNEVPFDIYKQIDDYRKEAGLPKLKEYSIEDFVDAMPGVNPKAEQALLDELITAKSGYAGEKYTAEDILNQAKRKKVETKTQGFNDFLARTTGVNALEKMSQPQLHAAFKALANLPEATDLNILPEGTNARRFDDKQYARALKGVDMFLNDLGAPADTKQVIDTIKEYTNLTEDSHAGAILDAAIKNGDVDLIKSARYEVFDPKTGKALPSTYASKTAADAAAKKRGLNVRQITTDAIASPTTSATLPEGFDIREGSFKEGEAPAGYEVSAGDEVLFKANTVEEANAKKASFERTRAGMANSRENQITQLNNAIEASQKRLNTFEAKGQGQTTQYEKAAGRHAKLVEETQAKIAALTEEIAKYDPKATPLEVKPTGTKAVGRKGYTVFDQGQARATYPTRQAAEEGILADMDEKQLQELTQQQGRRAIGKKAEAEIKRRTAAPQTEGKKVSEVLEGIEAEKTKAEEAKQTPGAKERIAQFEALLKPMLKQFGLGDVGLNIIENLKSEGSYSKKLIQIALDLSNPAKILRHESIHALKELGFFTPQQWKALERMAKDQWIDKYLKSRNATYNGQTMSRYDAYVKEYKGDIDKVIEEAIADAFADFANNKPPAGMLAALMKRLNDFFTALRNALAGAGFRTYEDVFGQIERGELKAGQAQGGTERLSVKEYQKEMKQAKAYEEANGIMPYVSEPIDELPTDSPRYSLQSYNPDKHLSYDATLGVPINKDGTITVYYHTTKENALRIAQNRMIPANGKERIYLTNESGGDAILNNRGNFDQDLDGSTVLVYVTPDKLQVDEQYDNGRRDFFIPLTEGDFFTKKMKMQSIQKSRRTAITDEFSYGDHEERIAKAIDSYKAATPAERRKLVSTARKLLKKEHNVGSLLTENGKLEKTRIGDYNISYDGYSVASQGLGLASAQNITDKVNTCPRSAICEGLCLGETSGGNFMFGGAAQADVGDIEKSAFRAGARMMQYLKTEALIINPEAFATLLQGEIDSLAKWCASPTQIKVDPETKKRMNVEKELYAPAIRLNVTSDFKPTMFRGLIESNPEIMFYDYTKLGSEPIADNHHLTYSSTGFGQMVDGKKVFFKDKSGKYDHNWATMRSRLNAGQNVAMAFSSKSGLPKFLVDTETGAEFKVLDGDDYDARFLDEKSAVKESSGGKGVIVGLRNKAGNMSEKNATVKTEGFFVQYDPKTDGDTVVVPNQLPFKLAKAKTEERLSLRAAPDTPEFKRWFGDSTIVNPDGTPKVMYHGTAKDITSFERKTGRGSPIFLTDDPKFAESFAIDSRQYVQDQLVKNAPFEVRQAKAYELIDYLETTQLKGSQYKPRIKKMRDEVAKGNLNAAILEDEGKYTRLFSDLVSEAPNIMAVYVKAENPFDYENPDHVKRMMDQKYPNVPWEGTSIETKVKKGEWSVLELPDFQDAIKKTGFDSFYVKEDGRKNLAVYESSQIKSATGNIGTYDKSNPDIRYSLRDATGSFDPAEIEKASQQGYKSKNKLVNMDIAEFLKLAKFGFDKEKEILAQKREQEGLKFTSIPYLYMQKDGNNLRVTGHEGRHRARALQAAGYTTMPVEWRTDIRWSEQTDPEKFDYSEFWPERIVAEEGALREYASIPMPFTREEGAQDYAGPQKQERLSLRDSTDPAILGRVDETTTSREETGFVERITKALGGESFSKLRAQALNRYQRLADYDKELAKTMGGAAFMADASAESAALMSDLAAGVTASAMGVHDRNGGIPVYKNGFTTVFNDDGKIKGPVAIFAPLAKYNDPFVYQLYQFWAGAQRGSRLLADGKEELFTQADLQKAKQLEAQYPEFKEIQADWNTFNNGLVQFLVDTGVLSEAQKEAFTKHSDYIPFYRQMDGDSTIGPNIFQSISGVKAPKKIKGGEAPLADFLETIVRNTQSSIQMGMKNVAAQRAVDVAVKINQAERMPKAGAGLDVVQVLENGNMVSYRVHDPMFIDAVKSLNMPDLPFIGLLSGPANLLRNLVTKDPGFMMANMVRDSMAAYVTSGIKMTPVIDTIKNFKSAMAGTSPEFQALLNAGLLGGYEFSQNVEVSAQAFENELKKKAGGKSLLQSIANPMTAPKSLWELLEKGTTASDAATRIEVYKRTLAETGNEAEALFRALEVMNFNRKGSSPVVRILTAAIPFLNARMQGLDVLYRASFGRLGHKDAAAIQRSFFVRGMTMAALSAMYWALTHDDDEYKKQEQETKDNNWLVPSLGVKIPIPFEIGVIFKVIPERTMAYFFGDDTGKDFMKSMARQLSSTLAVNPIPQAALPLVEATTNYSFFTQRAIVGQGMEGIAPEYQVGPNTSAIAAQIGSALGISPMKLDHIIGGYTGTMGMYMVSALDSIMNMNSDTPNASKRFEQMPLIKRFALDPEARGTVTSYYELKNAADQAVRTSNLLERTMNFEEKGEFMRDNIKLLASKEFILDMEKTMKEFRQMQVMIRSSRMDADAKRDALLRINQAQNALTANINTLKANVS
jgi:hypothetical protein